MNDYRIVTVCSHVPFQDYYCLEQFVKSLNGETLYALGTKQGEYGGLGSKPRLLYNAIKGGNVPEKHIIFCDCFDLVFAKSPKELFEEYLRSFPDIGVVISAEKNCFPGTFKKSYDEKAPENSVYKYLNSGMIVGETEAILTCLETMDAKNIPDDYFSVEKQMQINPNDQEYWQETYLKHPVPMTIDYDQILCNTLHSVKVDDLDFSNRQIRNKETNSYPLSFHLNGSAKTDGLRTPILHHLNLL